MVRGNIVYQGTVDNAIPFFRELGHECPIYSNPADFFIKVLEQKHENNEARSHRIIEEIKQKYMHKIMPEVDEEIKSNLNIFNDIL